MLSLLSRAVEPCVKPIEVSVWLQCTRHVRSVQIRPLAVFASNNGYLLLTIDNVRVFCGVAVYTGVAAALITVKYCRGVLDSCFAYSRHSQARMQLPTLYLRC
jgi:hypothetical protein